MKKTLVSLIAVTCLILLASAAFAAPKYTFQVTNDSPEDTVTQLMTVKFKELLESKSKGAFKADVYPSGQLGSDRELIQSAQAGDIAFVVQATAPQINFVPKVSVFDLPNLFPSTKIARAALDKFLPIISKEYEKAGLKILGIGDQGFRVMSSNKKVEKVADFKGIKIRTMENKYHMAYWKALGANPTPLPWAEVYLSLQQGTIVAQENPYEVIVAAKIYEQQKFVIDTNHILHGITIIMSKKIHDKLTPAEQKMVSGIATETVVWGRQQADKRHADRVAILKKNKTEIIVLPEAVLKEMSERAKPVYESIRKDIGSGLVDALLKEVKAAEGK